MKYPKITALTPAGEDFKAEAVNEGLWLTAAHMDGIEKSLADAEAAATKATSDLTVATTAQKTAEDALVTANASIKTKDARIAELEAENAKFKKQPAAEFQNPDGKDNQPPTPPPAAKKYETSIDRQVRELFG